MKTFLKQIITYGVLCVFAKIGVVTIECPKLEGDPSEKTCGYYAWGADLFMAEVDLYASDCGIDCDILPWNMKGTLFLKGCRQNNTFITFGISDHGILVTERPFN